VSGSVDESSTLLEQRLQHHQTGIGFGAAKWHAKDLHHMFLYYEEQKGPRGTSESFKKILPDALSAEDWFRFHGHYSNGEKIAANA